MCRGNIPDNTPVHTHYREDGGTGCHGAPDPLVRQDRNSGLGPGGCVSGSSGGCLPEPLTRWCWSPLTSCLSCLQRALVYLTRAGERTSQARLCRQKGLTVAVDHGGLLRLCSPPQRVTHTDQYGRTCPHCVPPLESLCLCHALGDHLQTSCPGTLTALLVTWSEKSSLSEILRIGPLYKEANMNHRQGMKARYMVSKAVHGLQSRLLCWT